MEMASTALARPFARTETNSVPSRSSTYHTRSSTRFLSRLTTEEVSTKYFVLSGDELVDWNAQLKQRVLATLKLQPNVG